MYVQVWKKYLPIIRILMKRSPANAQTLDMNSTDFARTVTNRKTNYGFSVNFREGRLEKSSGLPAIAAQLVEVLMEDDVIRTLLRQGNYQFSMNNKFQLSIKNASEVIVQEKQQQDGGNPSGENDQPDNA